MFKKYHLGSLGSSSLIIALYYFRGMTLNYEVRDGWDFIHQKPIRSYHEVTPRGQPLFFPSTPLFEEPIRPQPNFPFEYNADHLIL